MESRNAQLQLERLAESTECLTDATAEHLAESCMVTFDVHDHSPGVNMAFSFEDSIHKITVSWDKQVTETMRRGHRDRNKRTDDAACAIALMLVPEFTDYHGYEQSATGDRIDYYLRSSRRDDTLIFNDAVKLEVSGIDHESTSNTLEKRIKEKKARLDRPGGPSSTSKSTYICVVEFSNPKSAMVLT